MFQVNVRAVYTTLHILGSFVVLMMPAILTYVLVCKTGCRYSVRSFPSEIISTWFHCAINLLLVLKPLINPIIYAARMHEMKEATRRMQAALRWRWCGSSAAVVTWGRGTATKTSERTTITREPRTTLKRLPSNGSSQPQHTATVVIGNDNTTVL